MAQARWFAPGEGSWAGVPVGVPELLVAVRPDVRGTGVGAHLLAALLHELAVAGTPSTYLVVTRGNSAARALYGRLGFRVLDHSHGRLLMARSLTGLSALAA